MKALVCTFVLVVQFCFSLANEHPRVQRHEDLDYDYDPNDMFTLDYIFQLLNGLRSDDYVEGTIACGILAAKTQRDVYALWYYFSKENWLYRPDIDLFKRQHYEEAFFNVTGEVTENFPTLLYKCYSVPFATSRYWSARLS